LELLDALRAYGDLDVVRPRMKFVLQALIEAEATEQIGAARHERSTSRANQRDGHRARLLSTKATRASRGVVAPRQALRRRPIARRIGNAIPVVATPIVTTMACGGRTGCATPRAAHRSKIDRRCDGSSTLA
jgi:hypothetical protein